MISKIKKCKKLFNKKIINKKSFFDIDEFQKKIENLKGKNFIIDKKSCSIFFEEIIKSKFRIIKKDDPTYLLKSIKNQTEINNMIKAHILDGVALTKFIYWIKYLNKKKINEVNAQDKLEKFRKLNKNFYIIALIQLLVQEKWGYHSLPCK